MLRFSLGVAVVLLLAGCGGRFSTSYEGPLQADVARNWSVVDVQVDVPDTLVVNDANVLAPRGDIVWHGDPAGDRRAQVATVVEAGVREGVAPLSGANPVIFGVTVQEFHAVTPRAINSAPAAVHNISFTVQVFDANTAVPLSPPTLIEADLEALVGAGALIAAQEGRTQKVRITRHIAQVIQGWLGIGPDQRRKFTSLGR
ncbi:DUF6778 family protein [Ovoidimarina sediminis]|uniref:DUF6778 family protein n=1 Tax=Ovoidimarina sediminis TaxID=3079856 RepID=UPI0029092362|nr:DUF6778 family protein [Rhodophyticola sp. MJ-SS7]MDU8941940.1 DUF6778 family protein [Rhodophyticola sp. MJ-SS7]